MRLFLIALLPLACETGSDRLLPEQRSSDITPEVRLQRYHACVQQGFGECPCARTASSEFDASASAPSAWVHPWTLAWLERQVGPVCSGDAGTKPTPRQLCALAVEELRRRGTCGGWVLSCRPEPDSESLGGFRCSCNCDQPP